VSATLGALTHVRSRAQNPSVIATQTDTDWLPLAAALNAKYFTSGSSSLDVTAAKVNIPLLIAACTLVAATILMSLLNGDCGPGLTRPQALRKLLQAPSAGEGDLGCLDIAKSCEVDVAILVAGPPVPGVLFVSAAQLETVMAELRGLVSQLQPVGGGDGDVHGKLPTRRQSLNCEAAAADVDPAVRGTTPAHNVAAGAAPRWSTTVRP
jgi:hypothetical protein